MGQTSLTTLAREHLAAAGRSPAGRSAHTVVGGREQVLRHTSTAMTAGQVLAEHDHPGEATVPDAHHPLTAVEDSAVLLTVAVRS